MLFVMTLLVFAVVFYLLMRWGCGGRMVHGLHQAGRFEPGVDPVCGMRVEGSEIELEHRGRKLRFCSAGCRERFAKHPDLYLSEGV